MSACARERTLPATNYGDTGALPEKRVRCVLNSGHVGYHVDGDGLPFGPWIERQPLPPADADGLNGLAEELFRWNTPTDPHFVINGRAGDVSSEDPYLPIARAVLESDWLACREAAARREAWDEGASAFAAGRGSDANPYARWTR